MNEVQINKIKKRADEYATSCFPYEKQFLEREAVVKCCVHVVTETISELEKENAELKENYFYERCIRSTCPYIHKVNRNCMAVGGFFTAVSNKDCPMMKNLNANVKLLKAKEILRSLYFIIQSRIDYENNIGITDEMWRAEQFLKEQL